jgi:hypothetical protein
MAHVNKVLRSINADGGHICVDIFSRPDGTFGFEEYRRDAEDSRGWFPVGYSARRVYASAEAALSEARREVAWLDGILARDCQ